MEISNISGGYSNNLFQDTTVQSSIKEEVLKKSEPIETKKISKEEALKFKEKIDNSNLNNYFSFEFKFNSSGDLESMKIIDPSTKEIVRQIPSEEMVRVRERIDEYLSELNKNKSGILVNSKV